MRALRTLALLFPLLLCSPVLAQGTPEPITPAEASGYTRTATADEVADFLAQLAKDSKRVRLDTFGTTHEGRDIPLAIIADPPVASPEAARRSGKLVVLLFGNIHAGEVCGKDALLMIARDLATSQDKGVLEDLVVCLVPIYNADGNERFAPDNRPGQVGPEEMGIRQNAQGLDLNRDYVKLEAPETRAMVRFMNRWDPTVIVDTHTTNGSHHRYELTYQGPKHPAGDAAILEFVRDTMLPAIDADVKERHGYETEFYGNFAEQHTLWTTYPAEPRYGVAYRGMRNRLAIITEAYSYATFETRVLATKAFCESILRYSAEHASDLRERVQAADDRTTRAGRDPDGSARVPLRVKAVPFPDKITVLGYEEYDAEGNRVEPGEPRDYEVDLVNLFEPVESVPLPFAYVLPDSMSGIADHLQRHGIRVEVLREDLAVDAELYTLGEVVLADKPFEGHEMIRSVEARRVPRAADLKAGSYIVRTAQPLGHLAAYLLEPRASDGLVAWNFLDDYLVSGETYPILRVPARTRMTLRDARPLPEDRRPARRVTYEGLYQSRDRIDLDGSNIGGSYRWHDDDRLLLRHDGQWWLIDAATGRSEVIEHDTDAIAARLAEAPTIDLEEARQIAGRLFSRPDATPERVLFEHRDDLYSAEADGSGITRLTSTPEREELATLSKDGLFAAYIRDNDLWVVDTETGTPRAITTGARDDLRRGKASWVYFEEIFGRRWQTYWWSPDSRHIAFFETDSSQVPTFTIIHDGEEPQRIETTRYPKPGDPNPHVELFIAHAAGGTPAKIDLSGYDRGAYLISWVDWSEDGSKLRFGVQDRAQTWLHLYEVGPNGGKPRRFLTETTDAWVTPQGDPHELDDGSFIIASERDGWRHLYRYDKNWKLKGRITEGDFEVRSIHHIDEGAGMIYFTGTVDSPIAENLYRVPIAGGEPERLTREPGHHRVSMNDAGTLLLDTWSSTSHPPRTRLLSADGAVIREIDLNPVYELEEFELGRVEKLRIPSTAHEGIEFEAEIVYPPDFDASREYPVWFSTYAGPHAATVRDDWKGGRSWEQMLAAEGIIAFRADPYPASTKGAKSAWTAYRQLGVREMADIAEIITWLGDKPFVDASRIGMDGHSYGGFMTAYALTHSKLFAAGISGAPVTSWRDYDTIYTERYMDTPQANPEGYANTDVVAAAKDLHGRLMLVHGTMDDNVHMQNSIKLIQALQRANKPFDMFIYPGSRHGIWGDHYRQLRYDFIMKHMDPDRPDPKPESEADRLEQDAAEEDGPRGP